MTTSLVRIASLLPGEKVLLSPPESSPLESVQLLQIND